MLDVRERHWGQNPFVEQLTNHQPSSVRVIGFSWRRLVLGRYDILHLQWPEFLLSQPLTRSPIVQLMVRAFLLRQRMFATPIVRTRHNLTAHVSVTRQSERLLERINRQTTANVWLEHRDDPVTPGVINVVIPHGDYRPWMSSRGITSTPPLHDGAPLTFASFGILRPYKNYEQVIEAISDHDRFTATIAGAPADARYAADLAARSKKAHGRIHLIRRRLTDLDLANLIKNSDAIVVPYENLYNSGVVHLAISMNRPVIVQAGPTADILCADYGTEWVRTYRGRLTSEVLMRQAPLPQCAATIPASRQWSSIAMDYATLYHSLTRRERALG